MSNLLEDRGKGSRSKTSKPAKIPNSQSAAVKVKERQTKHEGILHNLPQQGFLLILFGILTIGIDCISCL